MATTPVEVVGPESQSLSIELFAIGGDVVVASAACAERSHNKGCYTFDLVDVAAGLYRVRLFLTATDQTVAQYALQHADTTSWEVCREFNEMILTGSGAHVVTITVQNPSTSPVQGASVRLSRAGEALVATTDALGQVRFSVNAATWTVSITASGYAFTPVELVVAANASPTYTLADNQPAAPSDPMLAAGYLDCYGTDGSPAAGVKIYVQQVQGAGAAGHGYDGAEFPLTSDGTGRVQHAGFVRGGRYRARRGEVGRWSEFVVPDSPTFPFPEVLGAP